jgi:antitoxin MazE
MFKEGLAVDLEISGDALVVKPVASAYELAALLAMVTPDNLHELVDFGPPVGKEVW